MDKQQTSREVGIFVKKLNRAYQPKQVILFGSRAKGEAWKRSDYDFIIVSSKFKKMPWLERISGIVKLWDPLADIDVLPYTPEEFEEKKKNSSVVRTALKEGKVIFG